jgi:hypothetical protein
MILGYSLDEAKKFVIAAVAFAAAIAAMFVAYDPGINEAAISIAGALIGIVGVFQAPQFSVEDLSKYLEALKGALIAMANFWFVVDPSWSVKISTAIAGGVALYAVYKAKNNKPLNVPAPA